MAVTKGRIPLAGACNKERINGMLEMIDVARQRGATHEDLRNVARYIDGKAQTSDSEWARIQLKILEPILGQCVQFNYFLNNWHLYLQTEIAKWLLGKKNERNRLHQRKNE